MTIFIFDNAKPAIRGELTKWLLELKPGVFIGKITALVRDLLWKRICDTEKYQGVMLICSANNEQGYDIMMKGNLQREVIDLDGLKLIKVR